MFSRNKNNGSLGPNSVSDTKGTLETVGEAVTYSFQSASIKLGGGEQTSEITFNGLTNLRLISHGNISRHFLDSIAANANEAGEQISLESVDFFQISYASGDHFRLQDLEFSVTVSKIVVPEPSTPILLGLTLSPIILRRQRRIT